MTAPTAMLLADGRIATTVIVERILKAAGYTAQVVTPETLVAQRPFAPLVISRLTLPSLRWLPAYLHRQGIPYVYFLDDNFFEIDPVQDPYHSRFFRRPVTRDTLSEFLRGASRIWVQSPPLADYLRSRFPGANVVTINAAVDLDLFASARAQLTSNERDGDDNGTLRIGYASTPRHHLADFISAIVVRTSERFGERVRFEFVGWWPDAVAAARNVQTYPAIADHAAYVAFITSRRWDVGLAPLGSSLFENCKTNLKFREYGALGIAGIYSDVPLFRDCVEPGVTGLLCGDDPAQWVGAIGRLLDDPAARKSIALRAHDVVASHYSNAAVAGPVAALMREIGGRAA